MPRVSIITPAYNAAPYIGDTIRSVLAQSFDDWEMIIADDGSTDGTVDAAREAAAGDARIRVIKFPPSRLPAIARNRALAHASGDLIAFLDADDLYEPEKLARQVAALGEASWGFSNALHFWTDGAIPSAPRFVSEWRPSRPFFPELMTSTEGVPFLTVIARRDALARISPTGRIEDVFDPSPNARAVEDWDLCLRLSQLGEPVYTAESLARYREHVGGISKAGEGPFERAIWVVEKTRAAGADPALCSRARRLQESKLAMAQLMAGKPSWRRLMRSATWPPSGARDLFFGGLSVLPEVIALRLYKAGLQAQWRGRRT
jgi:glycosyltransferase involved in cell wall biosynthesis